MKRLNYTHLIFSSLSKIIENGNLKQLIKASDFLNPAFKILLEKLTESNDLTLEHLTIEIEKLKIHNENLEFLFLFLAQFEEIDKKLFVHSIVNHLQNYKKEKAVWISLNEELKKGIKLIDNTSPFLYYLRDIEKKSNLYFNYEFGITTEYYFGHDLLSYYLYQQITLLVFYYAQNQIQNNPPSDLIDTLNIEFDKILKTIEIHKVEVEEINVLINLVHLIRDKKESTYYLIINSIESSSLRLHTKEVKSIYLVLINFLFLNKKEKPYGLILSAYQSMYSYHNNMFFNYLQPQVIKNIATLCLRTNNLSWFNEVFTAKNIKRLNKANQETLKLCEAKFLFHNYKYGNCIHVLNHFKTGDIFQDLELRRLQIMCFYELRERVLVDNYLNTFKVFIHRNETINKIYKDSNNNFMRFLNRLNKTIDIKKAESILSEINQTERIAEKQWITSKADELLTKLREEK